MATNSWLVSMRAVLVSTGVVLMAVIIRISLPVILEFLTWDELPLLLWFKPPYLYILINCIILSIVASSKLQPRGAAGDAAPPAVPEKLAVVYPAEMEREVAVDAPEVLFGYVDASAGTEVAEPPVEVEVASVGDAAEEGGVGGGERSDAVELSDPVFSPAEKLPVSARFGYRRSVKASPEGKALLKVSRPKRHETLESTWRTITEGRPMPLTRHLRKSDTFGGSQDGSPVRMMRKSDTFGGRSSPASGAGGKLRREPSLSQDELNRRVEAFIKKFNEEMRLQRQESLNQYRDMVSHGTH